MTMPTVKSNVVLSARWIAKTGFYGKTKLVCSHCRKIIPQKTPDDYCRICPQCGAMMQQP